MRKSVNGFFAARVENLSLRAPSQAHFTWSRGAA